MDMKRLVMTVVAVGAALTAAAMPTKKELQTAQEMVADVTESDVKALKSGTKKPAEVAAKHMELAAQAGSEAEKYLLLQGAFKLYAKAGDYDAAADALGTMNREIADMNPEVIVEIYNKAIFSSMKEKAPKLFAIKEAARRQVFYRKQLAKAEAAAKANPKDPAAQKKLGECRAELGDWTKALDAFANAGGDLAKSAKAESDGSLKPQELGDFWWDYSDAATYRLHAAALYRTALADDSFKGLARTRADQRVKEAEASGIDLPAVTVVGKVPQIVVKSLPKFDLRYGHHLHFKFYPCPAGSAKVNGVSVSLTRPFCLGVTPVTRREWFAVRREKGSSWKGGEEAPMTYVTYQEACDFAEKLTARFFKELPQGYVIRLPTAAEWCLAYQTGNTAPQEEESRDKEQAKRLRQNNFEIGWFGQGVGGTSGSSNMKKYYEEKNLPVPLVKDIWPDFAPNVLEKWDWCGYSSQFAPVPVGLKNANGLGLHDMYGNCFEMMLDCTDSVSTGEKKSKFGDRMKNLYASMGLNLTDPIVRTGSHFVMLGSHITPGLRGDLVWTAPSVRLPLLGFRLCVGPCLVSGNAATTTAGDAKNANDSYPCKDFGGELLSSKYEIVESTGRLSCVNYQDGLFNCQKPSKGNKDFAFEVSAKEKEVGFTLKLSEPVTLAGLLVVNRLGCCHERQVPLCVWASEDRVKWDRIFIDESVRDEYRIDLSKKNITCKYLRFGRLPGVNNEPFHLARTLVYVKKAGAGINQSGNSSNVSVKAPTPKCKMVNGRPAPLKFELAKGVDLELAGCPAGKFTMGYDVGIWNDDGKAAPKHEVVISRPFWIGKVQVTRGQAKALEVSLQDTFLKVQSAFDGKGGDTCSAVMTFDNMNAFCRKLTEKLAGDIPKGYVFRLASDAEWEYASKAGNYSEKNPAMLYAGHAENPYVLSRIDKLALLKKKGIEWKDSPVVLPPFPGGLKRPNAWGVCDMLGNHPEVTLDRISKNMRYKNGKQDGFIAEMTYGKQETDPLTYCESDWNILVRGRWDNYASKEGRDADRIQWVGGHGYAFRVCLGPDLVAEKKAKK